MMPRRRLWRRCKRRGARGMRLVAGFIAMMICVPALAGETAEHLAVRFVREVCTHQKTPEAIMATSNVFAKEQNWKTPTQTRAYMGGDPLPGVKPRGIKPLLFKTWKVGAESTAPLEFIISRIGPRFPDFTLNGCAVNIPGKVFVDETLSAELIGQFGSEIQKICPKQNGLPENFWSFAGDQKENGKCSRVISVSRNGGTNRPFTSLVLIEMHCLAGDKCGKAFEGLECQS